MKNNFFFRSLLLSATHCIICILSGAIGWQWQTVIVSVASILAIVLAYKRIKLSAFVCMVIIVPFFLIYICAFFFLEEVVFSTWPIWAIGLIVSFSTVLFLKYHVRPIISIPILFLAVLFGGLIVWPNTFSYYVMKPKPKEYSLTNSVIVDANDKKLSLDKLKGKVILFDLWHSACLPCIKQFPEIQKLYDKYKDDSLVKIISLNLPLAKDKGVKPTRFTNAYSFEKMYFLNGKEYEKFSDKAVPLILIMDKNMKCRYAGDLSLGWNVFIGNTIRIINKLKNE